MIKKDCNNKKRFVMIKKDLRSSIVIEVMRGVLKFIYFFIKKSYTRTKKHKKQISK